MVRPGLNIRVSTEPVGFSTTAQRDRAEQSRSPPPRDTQSPVLALPSALARATSPPITRPTPPPPGDRRPTPPPKDSPSWSPASRLTEPSAVSTPPSNARLLGSTPGSEPVYLYRNSAAPTLSARKQGKRVKNNEVLLKEAWRPAWLRKRVLGPFAAVFALSLVAAELVMRFQDGEMADISVEGIWTFGPVIIVSVLTALWSRVEFQTLSYTPWMILDQRHGDALKAKRQDASKTLLLDYISMGYIKGLYTAVKNRHYMATVSFATALLLRVQIFLSTGLFRIQVGELGARSLTVNAGNTHAMAAIFGLLALATLMMLPRTPSEIGISPRDPATIAGSAVLFANSEALLAELRDCGTKELAAIADKVRGPWASSLVRRGGKKPGDSYAYQILAVQTTSPLSVNKMRKLQSTNLKSGPLFRPWTLHLVPLFATLALATALLVGIWVLFKVKDGSDRFDAEGDKYFLWSSLVTLFFVGLAFYLACRDLDARRLAPYMKLATKECRFPEGLGLSYTNEFAPKTLLKSLRYRDWGVFLATWLTIFGWLMPIFSAGLFAASRTTEKLAVNLRQETYFEQNSESVELEPDPELVQTVLIQDTPKYPRWTYEELAFPVVEIAVSDQVWASSKKRFPATIPATRASLECEAVSYANGDGLDLGCKMLDKYAGDFDKCTDGQDYLGFVASSCSQLEQKAAYNYIWGDCSDDGTVTALMCNETIVQVDTDVTLMCDTLEVDMNFGSVPFARDDTEKPANMTMGTSHAYNILQNTTTAEDKGTAGLDPFFSTLVQSRLGVPLQRLGTVERTDTVAEAIKAQHGIIRAQALNSEAIRSPYSSSTPAPFPITATLDIFTTKIRQSAPQTYALTTLLILVILLLLLSLTSSARGVALPKNPFGIAAQASLLADSTLWAHLPKGAEWLSDEKLEHRLRKKTFRMGWFDGASGEGGEMPTRSYTIGIVEDETPVMRVELEGDLGILPDITEASEK